MAIWRIKRYVIEEYEVEAKSREEALNNAENPYEIRITKEICTKK